MCDSTWDVRDTIFCVPCVRTTGARVLLAEETHRGGLLPPMPRKDVPPQYLSVLGVAFFHLCRVKTCLFYRPDSEWVEAANGNHFRCPACGELYRPWAVGDNLVACHDVLVLQHPQTQQLLCVPCNEEDSTTLKQHTYIYICIYIYI